MDGKADAQDRGGDDADQDRLLALTFGKTCGCQPDNDRVIAGKHQVDHHDLEKRCQGSEEINSSMRATP